MNKKLFSPCSIISCLIPILGISDTSTNTPQTFLPGNPIKTNQVLEGYPPSASYALSGWDVFFTADYICWKWNQPISPIILINTNDNITTDAFISKNSTIQNLESHYTSGFQTGLGIFMHGMDDWKAYAEYTWYKNTAHSNINTGPYQSFTNAAPGSQFSAFHQIGTVNRSAKLGFNDLNVSLERSFYLGKKIASTLGIGLKNLWISQHYNANYDVLLTAFDRASFENYSTIKAKQTSWGIGPNFAFNSDWLLGYGLKLIGNLSASVLYTKYVWTGSALSEISGEISTKTANSQFSRAHGYYNFIPVTETAFGLGWGSYLCNQRFHIDLSALYDINVYWDYSNLFLDTPVNMMLHGLNIQARFDF